MALTIAKLGDNSLDYAGLTPFALLTLTGDSSYPAGGYPLTPALVGFGQHLAGVLQLAGNLASAGLDLFFNSVTGKLQILSPASGVGSQLTLGASSGTSTLSVCTAANLVTVTAPNTFVVGQFVIFAGAANGNIAKANGQLVQITAATAATFSFTWAGIGGAVTSGADTGITAQPVLSSSGPVTSGTATGIPTTTVLTSNVGTITVANSFSPGQLVVLQGLTNASALNGYTVQVLTASATQFTFNLNHANVTTGSETTGSAAPLVAPGGLPIVTLNSSSITNSVLTSNVVSLSAVQNYTPGTLVMIQGLTNGAALNGYTLAVIATGLTNALFEANFNHSNITTGADAGTASPLVVGGGGAGNATEVSAGTNLSATSWTALVMAQR